jgi:hypothetical protein
MQVRVELSGSISGCVSALAYLICGKYITMCCKLATPLNTPTDCKRYVSIVYLYL